MKYSDFLQDNEIKAHVQSMNSRAKATKASGKLSLASLRDRIFSCGGQCEYCTTSLLDQAFECDHIIPLQRGGGNIAENIAIACPSCNRSKSYKHPARFAQETIARTGITTPLLQRILTHYDVEPVVQRSLFETDESDSPAIPPADEDLPDEPPPYIWK